MAWRSTRRFSTNAPWNLISTQVTRRRGPCAPRRACAASRRATPSAARARGAARRAQAEAKAAKLKAELEEQYGIARARIEAAAADADTSPSPPPARRKPRRASARFRNLSLDDVPEEPAAVSTAGAAGRAVAAARAQRDDVDVLALSGSLASMLHAAEESDDESIAPPDEPPPNVPEDAVALAE